METQSSQPRWFCLRSQPRRTHVAAAHLRSLRIELFNVLALLPARQRIKVLFEFLGGLTEAEVKVTAVLPRLAHPLAV